MYLAPLNYDRYFRKVFSDLDIAKRFLEDFFDTTISHLEAISLEHKITDAAASVEFDFRCLMDGQPVIIDMQQWYKMDIVKRFYLYHSVSTALQLENIPAKNLGLPDNKTKAVKDYNRLVPVVTLIWMTNDMLGSEDDFISYAMAPETVTAFIRDKSLWKDENLLEILKKRDEVIHAMDNKSKGLDFLSQNRLIYVLQKNIVKNKKYPPNKCIFLRTDSIFILHVCIEPNIRSII